jgi:putative heme degradation protein
MKKYVVIMPIAGAIELHVEADSAKEAIEKAWELADPSNDEQVIELEAYAALTSGNVLHVSTNEISVTVVDE